jgi:hypothetical protein
MGFLSGIPILPPTFGVKTLAEKFGRGVAGAGRILDSAGGSLSEAGSSLWNGPGIDPAPDAATRSAVQIEAPSATAQIESPSPDHGSQPTQDIKAYNASTFGVQPSTLRGKYQEQPGYGEFGTTAPRSLAAMLQDREAAAQLDASYGARVKSNEAFAPDYQGDALRGRQRSAEYEALSTPPRPLFSSGETLGSFYKNGNTISNAPTGLTLRESLANQQNQLKNAPGLLDLGRGRLAEELQGLKAQYDAEVRTGKRTQPDADAAYARALQKATELSSLLKSGFPPNDPNAVPNLAAPPSPNK